MSPSSPSSSSLGSSGVLTLHVSHCFPWGGFHHIHHSDRMCFLENSGPVVISTTTWYFPASRAQFRNIIFYVTSKCVEIPRDSHVYGFHRDTFLGSPGDTKARFSPETRDSRISNAWVADIPGQNVHLLYYCHAQSYEQKYFIMLATMYFRFHDDASRHGWDKLKGLRDISS